MAIWKRSSSATSRDANPVARKRKWVESALVFGPMNKYRFETPCSFLARRLHQITEPQPHVRPHERAGCCARESLNFETTTAAAAARSLSIYAYVQIFLPLDSRTKGVVGGRGGRREKTSLTRFEAFEGGRERFNSGCSFRNK